MSPNQATTIWYGALGYYLGRMTYAVGDFCALLIEHWPTLPPETQALIRRDVERAFAADTLGMDCDRAEWARVRKLWTP